MKKYLFGLGAMLIGAGLMFVFTHTEVSAEVSAEDAKELNCHTYKKTYWDYQYCKIKDLTCVTTYKGSISCVKSD